MCCSRAASAPQGPLVDDATLLEPVEDAAAAQPSRATAGTPRATGRVLPRCPTVTVDALANDAGDLDPTTIEIRDPQTGEWGTTVVVAGLGLLLAAAAVWLIRRRRADATDPESMTARRPDRGGPGASALGPSSRDAQA